MQAVVHVLLNPVGMKIPIQLLSEVEVQCRPWNEDVSIREKNKHELIVLGKLEAMVLESHRETGHMHISVADLQKHREVGLF